ncbi:MAG: hypothetical protein IJW51_08445 [Clostridia bacterium]|nr:hypothetical protein [Clostridia bacterium]
MSDMLLSLKGCCCSIRNEDAEYLTGSPDIVCEVLDIDDEWIKIYYTDKTGRRVIKVERTESIWGVKVFQA